MASHSSAKLASWTTIWVTLSLTACSSTTGTGSTDEGGPSLDATSDAPRNEGCDACTAGPDSQAAADSHVPTDAATEPDAADGNMETDGGSTPDASDAALLGEDATLPPEGGAADSGKDTGGSKGESEAGATDGSTTTTDSSSQDAGTQDAGTQDAGTDASASTLVCTSTPCAGGDTLCNGVCVSVSDPAFGCGSCVACSPAHAIGACGGDGGACSVASCEPGWADTDGNPANGCETDLSSPSTCTSALLACSGGTPLCAPTGCVASCTPPLTTCGGSCVSLTASAYHCGSCGNACTAPSPDSFPTCTSEGTCGTPICPAGQIACSGQCVNPQIDGANCGSCGHACPAITNSVRMCSGATCGAVCEPGWSACGSTCTVLATDAQNCGSCGHTCGTNTVCVSGACEPTSSIWLATGLSTPTDITTDAQNVYWVDPGNGSVNAVAKAGGSVNALATSQAKPTGIAVDDTYAYWSDNLGGAIYRTLKAGGDTAHVVAAVTSPTGVAINASFVYTLSAGNIVRAAKAENATASVFAMPAFGSYSNLLLDGDDLYVFGSNGATGTFVFQIDSSTGTIENDAVLGELHGPSALAIGGDVIAATTGAAGAMIAYLNLATTNGLETFSPDFPFAPSPDAVASCGIVSNESQDGLLLFAYGTTVPALLLASPTAAPNAMVVDGNVVYWTDGNGMIGALPLP
jgi:hypothetical protein